MSGGETEGDGKRLVLRIGQTGASIEDRHRELLKRGVGQLRLALDTSGANDLEVVSELNREADESGLARARLSVKHQRPAMPGACVIQEALEHFSLSLSAEHLLSQLPRDHIGTLAAQGRYVVMAEDTRSARAGTRGFQDSKAHVLGDTRLIQTKEAEAQ